MVTTVANEPPRRLLVGLFIVYLVLLAWIILWKLEVPYVDAAAGLPRPWKLVPYVASGDAGGSAPLEVVANIILFVPFGIYLGMLAPRWRWWQLTGVFLGASLLLEIAQHLLSTGSFDTTDVIDNTVGGVVGLGVLALAELVAGASIRNRHADLSDRGDRCHARGGGVHRLAAALRRAEGCGVPAAHRQLRALAAHPHQSASDSASARPCS